MMVGCPTFTYPVLAPVSRCYPRLCGQVAYVLLTRSPLKRIAPLPIDLHVLGTPPAFILSQDQTLHLIDSLADSFVSLFFKLTFFSVLSCSVFKDRFASLSASALLTYLFLFPKATLFFMFFSKKFVPRKDREERYRKTADFPLCFRKHSY